MIFINWYTLRNNLPFLMWESFIPLNVIVIIVIVKEVERYKDIALKFEIIPFWAVKCFLWKNSFLLTLWHSTKRLIAYTIFRNLDIVRIKILLLWSSFLLNNKRDSTLEEH